jgi:hypothetical protein
MTQQKLSNQIVQPDLLEELSAAAQQELSGGHRHGYGGYPGYGYGGYPAYPGPVVVVT